MTKENIMEESLTLFANQGYENTTLANIADAVGIKKPSIYNHFDNKEAIFLSVLYHVAERESDYLISETSLSKDHTIAERLKHLYCTYLDHMSNSTEGMFFKRVTFFPPEDFSDDIQEVFLMIEKTLTDILVPILEQGIKEKVIRPLPTEQLTSAFYTLTNGLFLEENFYDKEVFHKRQEASWEVFWLGVQCPEKEE
ncbi:UNVERIFIED_CONTAM: TetR/AcrR family transcriptional regulator [Halobacillus marinus]|uniref:TetR/AcrR family transcriptional regulator n=1 Tax=Bacillaceae TaxID=186817 RepID=UPI0002A51645|nr:MULTISPECIES: TetR/AcrR family transcriptional regulator [Bacillaceae]ELK48868.1 TetR family transcriptional regulator [Halobacillus sp. BAB-2008]QHT45802.1 TetR/AcrR family transcriptional regulator [Bacillus sp. SB49]